MDQHEIDILVKAFNGLLDDEPNSSEKLDALEQKLSGLLGQNQQEPVPVVQNPFVQSNQEDPFASTQAPVQVKATEKRPVLSDEAATEMPTDEVKEDLTQKIAELRTELDFLKAETKEHKTQISQLQKEKEKFKEQATSMTEMTEMSMKFMLQETEEARETSAKWVSINQAIEQLGQEQFQGKDIIGKWFPASYLFKSPKDAQSNVEFFTAENLGLKYLVMYQLPLSSQESKVANLLIKFSLSKSTSIRRFSSAATILQELDAFLAQLCKAMGKADASWNATALVIDENMKELEFASSKFSLLQQEGRTFRIFESDKASQAKEQYLVRCLPIKPGAVLFVPSLSELPEHFTDWLAKISSMDNPQIYEEEISVWKGKEDLAVLMLKF